MHLIAALTFLIAPASWVDSAIPVVTGPDREILATGMLLAPQRFLTANHVADGLGSIVTIACGNEYIDGITTQVSPKYDLAIVELSRACLQHPLVKLANRDPEVGSRIQLVGYPAGMFRMVTVGTVSAYEAVQYPADYKFSLVTDATLYGGNSGGPVFDDKHRVVGLVSAGYCLGKGACYGAIVPISTIRKFLRGE